MTATGRVLRGGVSIAYRFNPGAGPAITFLPGFMSDMSGEKAAHLAAACARRGRAFLSLDYAGHGVSGGAIEDGTIGGWTEDALAVLDDVWGGSTILVGSSMGGWIALLVARDRGSRIAGLVGIAAAPDFTERLVHDRLTEAERATLARDGVLRIPSAYGGEQVFSRALIEEGRRHLLLDQAIPIDCPVRLLHGQADPDVPWETSLALAARITGPDVRVTLVKDAGHRLSRPADLALLTATVFRLLGEDGT